MKEALSSAKLWEARFGAADKSRQDYRENARQLITHNERLQRAVDQVNFFVYQSLWCRYHKEVIVLYTAN